MKSFKPVTILGIDIGSRSIRIVEIHHSITAKKLTKFLTIDVSSGLKDIQARRTEEMLQTRTILDDEALDVLKKEIIKNRLRTKNLTAATSAIPVNMVALKLPYMTMAEIEEVIPREVRKKMIPIPPPDAIIRFKLVDDRKKKTRDMIDLIAVSADRKHVEDFTERLKRAGLSARTITTNSFAMFNAYLQSYPTEKGINVAMLDIGSNVANTIIIRDNAILFSRDMNFGVNRLSDALSKNLDITKEEAKTLLAKYGIPEANGGQEQVLTEGVDLEEVRSSIQPALEMFSGELRRSFIYYRDQFRGQKVSKLLLSGGGALIKNIDSSLSKELGIKVEVFNPLKNIKVVLPKKVHQQINSIAPILTTAIGLGLDSGTKDRINLLPRAIRQRTQVRTRKKWILSAALLMLFTLSAVYIKLDTTVKHYMTEIAKQESVLEALKPAIERNEAWKQKISLFSSQMSLLDFLSDDQPRWYRLFQDISLIMPEELLLNNWEIRKGIEKKAIVWKVKMFGSVFSDYETARKILTVTIEKLEKSVFFRNLRFDILQEKDIDLLLKERRNFIISCELDRGYLERRHKE